MLSDSALDIFRSFIERNGDLPVDDSNREAFHDLVHEGLMIAGHSFSRGRESFYALTNAGKKFVVVLERGSFACAKDGS